MTKADEWVEVYCHDPSTNEEWVEYICPNCSHQGELAYHYPTAAFPECTHCEECGEVYA